MSPVVPVTRAALRVYLVLDLERAGERAVWLAEEALAAGITCLQLRDKRGTMTEVERVAAALRSKLRRANVPLIVNDRLDVALGVEADGVHVGQTDESVERVLARAAAAGCPGFPVGVSVTTVAEGRAALDAGASHLSVSPVFGTGSKPDAPAPAGLDGVRLLRSAFEDTPVVAIGGIKPENAAEVVAAGADGVAFVSAVTDSGTPAPAVRALAAAVDEGLRVRSRALRGRA